MKKHFLTASFLVLLFSFAIHTADARSGCCSHHGGVCGCGCCDGSPLSAICAPYYPECNSNTGTTNNTQAIQTTVPTVTRVQYTPRPTATLTPTTTPTMTPKPTNTPTPKPTKKAVQLSKPKPQTGNFWTQLLQFFHLG